MDGAPTGTVTEALRHAARLLRDDARAAAAQAREILRAAPGNADAARLLGTALRRTGEDEAAERAELDAIAFSVGDPELMRPPKHSSTTTSPPPSMSCARASRPSRPTSPRSG